MNAYFTRKTSVKFRDGWPIRSDRDPDRTEIVKKKIDRMIAIPLDQSYFFKIFLAYTIFNYIYNKFITIDKVSHLILYLREKN